MKKLLLLVALLAGSLSTMAADFNDYVTAKVSGSNKMDICLTNDSNFVAFQMDITLPAGVSFDTDDITATARLDVEGDWESVTIGGAGYDQSFVIVANCIDETANTYRIVGYSLGNHVIDATSGESIFSIALTQGDQTQDLTTSTFSNVIFVTESDLAELTLTATVKNGVLIGDVTKDGVFNISDIMAVIELINADMTNAASYDLDAADTNSDGVYNISDLMTIIELVNAAE